jgi:predicted amidohydrolase YtcJ
MTHEYTLLTGGRVIRGGGAPDATAIAWAADTILAVGSDAEVRAISRGDSHFVALGGRTVIPLATDGEVRWPVDAALEVGGPADLAVIDGEPGAADGSPGAVKVVAHVRGGRVVAGSLPGVHA